MKGVRLPRRYPRASVQRHRSRGLGALSGYATDTQLQQLAGLTTLSMQTLRNLVENDDLWINLDANGDISGYGANTMAGAAALVGTGGFSIDPSISGTSDKTVNDAIRLIEFLNVPAADVQSGAVFAQYHVTDPALIAKIQTAYAQYRAWQVANAAKNAASMNKFALVGAAAVIGGGLLANAFLAPAASSATSAATAATDVYGAGGGELTAADVASGNAVYSASDAALANAVMPPTSAVPNLPSSPYVPEPSGVPPLATSSLLTTATAGAGTVGGLLKTLANAVSGTAHAAVPGAATVPGQYGSGGNTLLLLALLGGGAYLFMQRKPKRKGK